MGFANFFDQVQLKPSSIIPTGAFRKNAKLNQRLISHSKGPPQGLPRQNPSESVRIRQNPSQSVTIRHNPSEIRHVSARVTYLFLKN